MEQKNLNAVKSTPAGKIKVLIADDHQMFIDGLKSWLQREKRIEVVAQALNGEEAYNIICRQPIDLLISDISMPVMTGLDLAKKVKQNFPHIKVLIISMYKDREIVSEVLMAEADGYILKNADKQEFFDAIHKLAGDGTHYSNEILSIMLEKVKKEKKKDLMLNLLSEREIEIVKLIMQEFSSEEIGEKLFISKSTVDTHRKNILEKTQVKTIVGLCKFAFTYDLAG